jgi:large subunit ribosomal protein L41
MKPTEILCKRVARHALSTKQTNKGFYKGTGTGSTGRHTQHGGYIIEWEKVRTYVVPKDLKDFKVYWWW